MAVLIPSSTSMIVILLLLLLSLYGCEQVDLPVTDKLPFNMFVLATTPGPKSPEP